MTQTGPSTSVEPSPPADVLPVDGTGALTDPPELPLSGSETPFAGSASDSVSLTLDAVLSPYVIVFCVAFVVAYFFTPIMRTIAVSYGIVDQPDPDRKIHSKPVAYLGGMAVFLGFIAGLAVCQRFSENHHPAVPGLVKIPLAILGATCLIVVIGLLDDLKGASPKLKILGQVASASLLLAADIGTHLADQVVLYGFAWVDLNFGIEVPHWLESGTAFVASAALVIALVVFCCNASNLMDGLDGLCGGITVLIALGLIIVSAHLAMTGPATRAAGDAIPLVLSIALLGAVLGFLPFNFNPASIFMGDSGSLLMGFVIATTIILLGQVGAKWMLGGLVMFSLPMLDTGLAFARRHVNKRPYFTADKHHFHHQLLRRAESVPRAVMLSYGLTIFFVASGSLLVFLRTRYAVAFYLVLFGSIVVAAYKMGMVHERPRRGGPSHERAGTPVEEPGERMPLSLVVNEPPSDSRAEEPSILVKAE